MSLLGLCLVHTDDTRELGFEHLRGAITLEPKDPAWHVHLGKGLTTAGRYVEAEKTYAHAAELSAGHAGILMQWGKALRLAGRPSEASQVYARVIQARPSKTAWLAASEALSEAGDTETAAIAYEKAFPSEDRPDFAAAHLAELHIALGGYDKAKNLNDALRQASPNDPDPGLRAAKLMRLMGDVDGARALTSELWEHNTDHGGVAAALLQDGKGDARALAETIANDETADKNKRQRCAFALCAFADKTEEIDAAWAWARLANSLYPKSNETLEALRGKLDKAIMAYQHMVDTKESAEKRGAKMLYIIGAPRSGGTLLQTILARHPAVRSVGERGKIMGLFTPLLDAPEKLTAQIEPLAKADIAGMTRAVGLADYFVDKTPHYVLLAGLLSKLHAGAQFIAPHRDEKDTAVSLFFHDYGAEFPFTRSLSGIQEYLDFHETALVRWREAGVNIISHNHDRFVADIALRGEVLCKTLGLVSSEDMFKDQDNVGALNHMRLDMVLEHKGRGDRYAKHLSAAGFLS